MVPNGTSSWNTTAYEKQGDGDWAILQINGSDVYASSAERYYNWRTGYYYKIQIAGLTLTDSADNVYFDDIRIFK